jgi:hypothetical protein
MIVQGEELSTVELNWREVFYHQLRHGPGESNIDQELGWCETDVKAIKIRAEAVLEMLESRASRTMVNGTQ